MRELYAHRQSVIHQTDARVKLIFTLALILMLNLLPNRAWPSYILLLALILTLILLSRLSLSFVLKRALLTAPFVLASASLVFFGPVPHASLSISNAFTISYSPEGLARFISIAIRAWLSVQTAILLAATTRFQDLLTAMQHLKVPTVFVAIIGLMWRYLFVISDEATRLTRACSSRSASAANSPHKQTSIIWRAKVTGNIAGNLFLRSIARSDRVYAAMLSRGYTGEQPDHTTTMFSKKDLRMLALGMIVLALIWMLGILTGG